jgi:2-haloacid dehalogenase
MSFNSGRSLGLIVHPQPLPAPRWLSFDCYGTLIDWESGIRRAFRELLRATMDDEEALFETWQQIQHEKIQGSYAPYAEILQSSFRETAAQFGYHCAAYAGEAFLNSLARWTPFSDVNPALSRLSQRHKLAIVSNIDRGLLGWTLRHFETTFDVLITAEDAHSYKPNPELFRYALKKLGCAPDEILHVASCADYDLRPASALGFRVAYLDRNQLPPPELPLEAQIKSMDELIGLWKVVPERSA